MCSVSSGRCKAVLPNEGWKGRRGFTGWPNLHWHRAGCFGGVEEIRVFH